MDTNPNQLINFEDAAVLLDVCRDELERGGFNGQAEALRGIEVLDRSGAEVALLTVRQLPNSSQDLDMLKKHVAWVLSRLINSAAVAA